MQRESKLVRLLAMLFALSLVAAACGDDDDDSAAPDATDESAGEVDNDATTTVPPAPDANVQGGTLVWAHEQEPPNLHLDDPENNLTITSWILQSMQEGLYGVSGSTEFFPELLAE